MHKNVIFFDGICNLCTRSAQWILRHDGKNNFLLSSLQGQYACDHLDAELLKNPGSLLLLQRGKIFSKSTAVLKIASGLSFPINLLAVFLIIPPFLRNPVYDLIAVNRYQWFGKKDECWLPDKKYDSKFLK